MTDYMDCVSLFSLIDAVLKELLSEIDKEIMIVV